MLKKRLSVNSGGTWQLTQRSDWKSRQPAARHASSAPSVAGLVAVPGRLVGDERALVGRDRERDAHGRDRGVAEGGREQRRVAAVRPPGRAATSGGSSAASASGTTRASLRVSSLHSGSACVISRRVRERLERLGLERAVPLDDASCRSAGSRSRGPARPSQNSRSAHSAPKFEGASRARDLRPAAEHRILGRRARRRPGARCRASPARRRSCLRPCPGCGRRAGRRRPAPAGGRCRRRRCRPPRAARPRTASCRARASAR